MLQVVIPSIVVLIGILFYTGIGCILTAMLSCNHTIQSIACVIVWPIVLVVITFIFVRVNIDDAFSVCSKVYHKMKLIFTCRQ